MTSTITKPSIADGWLINKTLRITISRKSKTHTHRLEIRSSQYSTLSPPGSYSDIIVDVSDVGTSLNYELSEQQLTDLARYSLLSDGYLRIKLYTFDHTKTEVGSPSYYYIPMKMPPRSTINPEVSTMGTYRIGQEYTIEQGNPSIFFTFFDIGEGADFAYRSDVFKYDETLTFTLPYDSLAKYFTPTTKEVTVPAFVYTMTKRINSKDFAYMIGQAPVNKEITLLAPLSPPTFNPIISILNTDEFSVGLLGNNQSIMQTYSSLTVGISEGATPLYGTNLVKYIVEVGDIKKEFPPHTTVFDIGKLDFSGEVTVKVSALDSRGNIAHVTENIYVIPYQPPSISAMSVRRGVGADNSIYLTFGGKYSPLVVGSEAKNMIHRTQYRYKVGNSVTFSEWKELPRNTVGDKYQTDVVRELNADPYSKYTIEFLVGDSVSPATVKVHNLPSSVPILFADTEKNSVGINMFPKYEDSLEVDGRGYFSEGLTVQKGDLTLEPKSLTMSLSEGSKAQIHYNEAMNSISFSKVGANGALSPVNLNLAESDGLKKVWTANNLILEIGSVLISPVADTPTAVTVTFSSKFPTPPIVLTTTATTVIGKTVLGHTSANITNTTADIYITRTNSTNTRVQYIAIWTGG